MGGLALQLSLGGVQLAGCPELADGLPQLVLDHRERRRLGVEGLDDRLGRVRGEVAVVARTRGRRRTSPDRIGPALRPLTWLVASRCRLL